jgi:hypothetical protein
MHQTLKALSNLSRSVLLVVMVSAANADDRVMHDGEYWGSGRIQTFEPSTGLIFIGDRRFQLGAGADSAAQEREAPSFLEPGREVIFRESAVGGSTGTVWIKEIRALDH